LIISVIDSGMGISELELKNIFEGENNFIRKDYNVEGSGLGLSIAKFFANALNHEIKVCSEVGKGSEFSLILNSKFPKNKKQKNSDILFYTQREQNCGSSRNKLMIQNYDSLNQYFSYFSDDCSQKLMNEFDMYSSNQQIEKSNFINKKSSFNSDWSLQTNKLDELYFNFDKEDLINHNLDLYNNCNDYSLSMINLFSQGELCDYNITNKMAIAKNNNLMKISKKKTGGSIMKNSKFKIEKINEDFDYSNSHRSSSKISIKNELNFINNISSDENETRNYSYVMKKPSFLLNNDIRDNSQNKFKKDEEKCDLIELANNIMSKNNDSHFFNLNNIPERKLNKYDINSELIKKEESFKSKNKCGKNINPIVNIKKNKILIIDDHKIIRESLVVLIKKILKNLNKENIFEIIEGFDGVDILSSLIHDQSKENEIKCVITDENMEYINGS